MPPVRISVDAAGDFRQPYRSSKISSRALPDEKFPGFRDYFAFFFSFCTAYVLKDIVDVLAGYWRFVIHYELVGLLRA